MIKYIKICMIFWAMISIAACSSQLDDQLNDPNNVTPENLDVNYLTNKVFVGFSDFWGDASSPCMELSRMTAMTGGDVYERAYQAQSHNAIWTGAYQDVLVQVEELLKAIDGKNLGHHSGAAKVLKAYTYITLVDLFGDVPYTSALNGPGGDFNPGVSPGSEIYPAMISLLDEAIADLGTTPLQKITFDIYYAGDAKKWAALANTLKLKAYMNMSTNGGGKVAEITALLGADLVDTEAESFTYKYGSAAIPAKSRTAIYRQMYQPTAGEADGYLNNQFLLSAYNAKGIEDPRWRYYFYRQVGSIDKALDTEVESLPCILSPKPDHYGANIAWCSFDPGFFGREHGNNDGIPPDGRAITVVGVYPFGGRVDSNGDNPGYQDFSKDGQGANGAGIEPIWMASFTSFLKAEAYQRLGISGDAKAALLDGVTKSVESVKAFAASKGQAAPEELVTPTQSYVDEVESLFDSSPDKLNVIIKEFWLAAYGNGVEGYNMYRRTGKPSDMQPMRAANPGNFIRSFIYPANFVNLNSSATQKNISGVNKVFWDTNADDFIK